MNPDQRGELARQDSFSSRLLILDLPARSPCAGQSVYFAIQSTPAAFRSNELPVGVPAATGTGHRLADISCLRAPMQQGLPAGGPRIVTQRRIGSTPLSAGPLTIGLHGALHIREERLSIRSDACRLMYVSDLHLRPTRT